MSLRWKLVLLYALILTLVIGGICVALPLALRRTLVLGVDAELVTRARAVGAVTEFEQGAWIVETKSGVDEDFAPDRGLYYVMRAPDGAPAVASLLARTLQLEPLPAGAPGAEPGPSDRRLGTRHFREATHVVIKSQEEEEPAARGARLLVTCGKDLRDVDATVHSLVAQLLILGPVVLLLSLAGGLMLAGRALRPIDRIARTAAEIGASDLTRRIDVRGRDELARLGHTLNDTFDRLQEAVERQRRFTADASHELRTPLAVVAGAADLALRRPRGIEDYRDALAEIRLAAQRMECVVSGLLTLARADAGGVTLAREPVALRSLATEVMDLHQPLAAQSSVTLQLEGDDVVVLGDRERLRDLLANLITNAIRYNRPDGSVVVRFAQSGAIAQLEVQDDGLGIPAAHLPHVFERFYRVDAHRSRDAGGAGLGLAISKWVAQAHGGSIEVRSEPGRGSCFVVRLPAATAELITPDRGNGSGNGTASLRDAQSGTT